MPKQVHFIAGLLSTLTIATFFLSTVIVELFGTPEAVATVKALIVMPGLFILVPAIAATGGSVRISLMPGRHFTARRAGVSRMPGQARSVRRNDDDFVIISPPGQRPVPAMLSA